MNRVKYLLLIPRLIGFFCCVIANGALTFIASCLTMLISLSLSIFMSKRKSLKIAKINCPFVCGHSFVWRLGLRFLGIRAPNLNLSGRKHRNCIMIANHRSFWDLLFMWSIHQDEIRFIMKKSLFWLFPWGLYAKLNQYPFIARPKVREMRSSTQAQTRDLDEIQRCVSAFQSGKTVWFCFVEGTRLKKNSNLMVLPPKASGLLALLTAIDEPVDIIDLTIMYAKNNMSFWDMLSYGTGAIQYRSEIFSSDQIPNDPRGIARWLRIRWKEKEMVLHNFYQKKESQQIDLEH